MDQLPLVSIVTIVYNGEKYIEHTIKSVLGQTYQHIEYIIVDGGSKDNTLSIVRKYEDKIAVVISEPDKGISDAFNKGIRAATGNIIGIINADDWYEPDAVKNIVEQGSSYDVVFGNLQLWKEGKKDFMIKGNLLFLEKEMSVNHPTVFVKSTCYQQFGTFDLSFRCAMDYDLMLRLKVNGCRFGYVDQVISNMRWEGFSDKRWMLGCRETLAIKNNYLPARKWRNYLYFYKHVIAIALPKFVERIGLGAIVKAYRSRFSRIKKVYV
ncbi:glycosyltransferase family 2 protein [Paraflavitalea pollutisoli]|uniref:glycosyltransferase family 2 protein n=1 Tax=Paraflavitalea pollutisoli TaxID=3034143 RepID=UPI0023EB1099|nr:glycosyltransferase family 2 protein [Paraflavitalea sp. H1-2-19X]